MSLRYMEKEGHPVTRAIFEENLTTKTVLPAFVDDIPRLLPPGVTFDIRAGIGRVHKEIIALLPADHGRARASRNAARMPRKRVLG